MDAMPDASDLVAQARDTRVVVIGGGLAGAVAALECARVGMTVTVIETADRLGGALDAVELDGLHVDAAVDSFDPAAPALGALLAELDLADRVEPVTSTTPWIGDDGGAAPLPGDALLGIPANPWDAVVRRHIGWTGTWRAYLDRLRPPLTIGHERNLDALVRSRMGDRVCDRMVTPVTRALFGVEPALIDVEAVAPGLGGALTRTGSLAGAVAVVGTERQSAATLPGTLAQLLAALTERLEQFAVQVRTGQAAQRLVSGADGWTVIVQSSDEVQELPADVVVLATGETAARDLLEGIAALPQPVEPAPVDVVTLRVRMPDPGRADVFPRRGDALRLTDLTATRPWIAAAAPDDRILRIVLAGSGADDDTVFAAARDAASAAFGHDIAAAAVRGAGRARVQRTPAVVSGHDDRVAAVRRTVHDVPGLAVVGGWLAGDELAEVVDDAIAESARLRRTVLWGEGAAEPRP